MTGRAKLINAIPGIEQMSYLELGVEHNETFNAVRSADKESVDINYNPTHKMTTDAFFKQNKKEYDVILIDACHEVSQVLKDYNNATEICRKFILIHDMVPPNRDFTRLNLCGDGYKLLLEMLRNGIGAYPLDGDFGLTLIFPPFIKVDSIEDCDYEALKSIRKYKFNELQELIMAKKNKRIETEVVDGDLVAREVEGEDLEAALAEAIGMPKSIERTKRISELRKAIAE